MGIMNATSRPLGSDNLLGIPPTLLPEDHPDTTVAAALEAGEDARDLARRFPTSSLAWATLAQEALDADEDVEGYAYARVGYHRGLDALRKAGWRGQGPVPSSHAPNRGFLKALALLSEAARRIGETDEYERVHDFLLDADPSLLG
jgi:hypothetical protein